MVLPNSSGLSCLPMSLCSQEQITPNLHHMTALAQVDGTWEHQPYAYATSWPPKLPTFVVFMEVIIHSNWQLLICSLYGRGCAAADGWTMHRLA